MVNARHVPRLAIGFAAVLAGVLLVSIIPVGAQTPSARTQPVTVTNTPLPVTADADAPVAVTGEVTAASPVSFDGFRDGFAIAEGGSRFVEFPALYVSLIVVSGSEDDIVDLSFFYQEDFPRFTMSGTSITLPLSQPIALDAVGVTCGLGSGECNLEVSLLGTAAG